MTIACVFVSSQGRSTHTDTPPLSPQHLLYRLSLPSPLDASQVRRRNSFLGQPKCIRAGKSLANAVVELMVHLCLVECKLVRVHDIDAVDRIILPRTAAKQGEALGVREKGSSHLLSRTTCLGYQADARDIVSDVSD